MATTKIKITKEVVQNLPFTINPQERKDYYDSELPNFGVRVSGSSRKYFVMSYVGDKRVRVTLGDATALTAEQARKNAKIKLGKMASGIDPNEAEREQQRQKEDAKKQIEVLNARKTTLQQNFDTYLDNRKLKESTKKNYTTLVNLHLPDWLSLPLCEITKSMITDRHRAIALGERARPLNITVLKTQEEMEAERKALEDHTRTRGQKVNVKMKLTKKIPDTSPKHREASADGCMRVLRTVINYAMDDNEDLIPVNPTERLSRRKEWYNVPKRRRLIKNSDLPAWHKEVMSMKNENMRDYLLFLLFTGLRRNEAARIKWKLVNFPEKVYRIIDTKNKIDAVFPMSDYLFTLFKRRKKDAINDYVFPGEGKGGYLVDPSTAIESITEQTGIIFTCHDLRRTFVTIAESLDISHYTLKALLNHKYSSEDVTGGYIIINPERLREPVQQITNAIIKNIERSEETTEQD